MAASGGRGHDKRAGVVSLLGAGGGNLTLDGNRCQDVDGGTPVELVHNSSPTRRCLVAEIWVGPKRARIGPAAVSRAPTGPQCGRFGPPSGPFAWARLAAVQPAKEGETAPV